MSFMQFTEQITTNPLLALAVVLTMGVILVNGWTDAPNAIATCVVTRCMSARGAIFMAAVFNFLGVFNYEYPECLCGRNHHQDGRLWF